MNLQEKTRLRIENWSKKYGSLSFQIETQIEKLVLLYEKNNEINKIQPYEINGTSIIREYQGKVYTVFVLEKGFSYNKKQYRSLSAIANEITGTHCNGKKFFGVTK